MNDYFDRMKAASRSNHPEKCSTGRILDNPEISEPLRIALQEALDHYPVITYAAMITVASEEGVHLNRNGMSKHRMKKCRCFRKVENNGG